MNWRVELRLEALADLDEAAFGMTERRQDSGGIS